MSGTHDELVEEAAKIIEEDPLEKRCFSLILAAILRNQLITAENSQRPWRVKPGTGMVLKPSGEVSDSAFHHMAEKRYAAHGDTQARCGIKFYGRFKDDGIIIFSGSTTSTVQGEFMRGLIHRGRFFQIKIEQRTRGSFVMLDVEFRKDSEWRRTGRLSYYCFTKPISIFSPLLPSSAHPVRCHLGWPRALLYRFRALSCTRRAGNERIDEFATLLQSRSGFDPLEQLSRLPAQSNRSEFKSFLVLPLSKEWEDAGFGKILRDIGFFGGVSSPRIAFKLSGRHLLRTFEGYNKWPGCSSLAVFRKTDMEVAWGRRWHNV